MTRRRRSLMTSDEELALKLQYDEYGQGAAGGGGAGAGAGAGGAGAGGGQQLSDEALARQLAEEFERRPSSRGRNAAAAASASAEGPSSVELAKRLERKDLEQLQHNNTPQHEEGNAQWPSSSSDALMARKVMEREQEEASLALAKQIQQQEAALFGTGRADGGGGALADTQLFQQALHNMSPANPEDVLTQEVGGVDALMSELSAAVGEANDGGFSEYRLGSTDITYYHSSRDEGEAGWACGYKNAQMVMSHLLKAYPHISNRLFGGRGFVPCVAAMQLYIERAWKGGWDPEGCLHFQGQLANRDVWIGTTEVAALLRSMDIRCNIHAFTSRTQRVWGPQGDGAGSSDAPPAIDNGADSDLYKNTNAGASSSAAAAAAPPPPPAPPSSGAGKGHDDDAIVLDGSPSPADRKPRAIEDDETEKEDGGDSDDDVDGDSDWAPGNGKQKQKKSDWLPLITASKAPPSSDIRDYFQPERNGRNKDNRHHPFNEQGNGGNHRGGRGGRGRGRRGRGRGKGGQNNNGNKKPVDPAHQRMTDRMFEYVWNYYGRDLPEHEKKGLRPGAVRRTSRPPLYFQHQGHSRTIIGAQKRSKGSEVERFLLIFDPGAKPETLMQVCSDRRGWEGRFKRGVWTLRQPDFEILEVIPDSLLTEAERERSKVLGAFV
ncbi:unnamed protein product [Vitrella brassicaformis CCMP3155]|uniref:UFSP1/2/DUB catalytic domain-containing protein n=2 Tax=Vitrella brassicaformis TaxID=1169539 RepID=A0A0G4EUE4_VITBC|nr:unnamed protein product [Vitrella brassicaformis CCMP3155]|eukprot:CEM01913.1 unnamed protein product [Vitrella brassicaformis CCMP3155]